MTKTRLIAAVLLASFASGCAAPVDPALIKQQQILLQKAQTRIFDSDDKNAVARGVVSALQDLNFIIVKADAASGIISGRKFGDYPIEMTVTIQALPEARIAVHGDARYDSKTIEDAATYREFFSSLRKSLPVTARSAD